MRSGLKRSHSNLSALLLCPALLAVAGLSGCGGGGGSGPGGVAGRYLLTVGDADMAASAWANKQLGDRDPAAKDMLTLVTLPIVEPVTPFAQVEVSNSAIAPPTCLSATKDGRYAFVVEYRGAASADAKTTDDLPVGNKVTAVDMRNPLAPVVCAVAEVGKHPIAVAAHPAGDLVLVVAQAPRQQIVILPFSGGEGGGVFTGEPSAWPLLGLDDDEAKPTSIAWHPGGLAFAITLQERGEVMFYHFKRDADGLAIAPWGSPVKVGKAPFGGAFTPDGRHFVVNDLRWGADVEGYNVGAPEGQLVSIRVADMAAGLDSATGGAASHVVVSSTNVGVSPVGMAISSDSGLVVTANLRRSILPDNDPSIDPASRGGSISLATLDRDGTLHTAGEFPINAVPAGICFDANNRYICVTQFRSFDPSAVDGEVGFWRVHGGSSPSLTQEDFYVGVGKGPHGVLIIR